MMVMVAFACTSSSGRSIVVVMEVVVRMQLGVVVVVGIKEAY